VEGPKPRPGGLTKDEEDKLKEYAAKTVEMMVERRKRLRDRLSSNKVSVELRKHAGVSTSLGDVLYTDGDYVTAMRLYQESVQTIMYVEEDGHGANPPVERQAAMAQLLVLLSVPSIPPEKRSELVEKVKALYDQPPGVKNTTTVIDGLPGLFHGTKIPAGSVPSRPLPGLFFNEVFKIEFGGVLELPNQQTHKLDYLPFTVPLEECSKATLFNMGQVHYHWGSQETALQFFHLAASVSQQISPLAFDPIDLGKYIENARRNVQALQFLIDTPSFLYLGCVNNMAQIHLQFGQPDDAMKMLVEALDRGNRTLASMYRSNEPEPKADREDDGSEATFEDDGEDDDSAKANEDARHTSRLRRKLARTLINIGHVHYFNGEYDAAMQSLRDAARLIDSKTMTGRTRATIHYNMALTLYQQGKRADALPLMDIFLEAGEKFNGAEHLQNADALYHKGTILFAMGNFADCLKILDDALRIQEVRLGPNHSGLTETLSLYGKALLATGDNDAALAKLTECMNVYRKQLNGSELNLDAAQTLLDVGKALHMKGQLSESLKTYIEVLEWTKNFFGPQHPFVARILGIVGNLYVESGKADESKPFLEEAARIEQAA
jgi:tetratricopeptide (TPR) repeat protein